VSERGGEGEGGRRTEKVKRLDVSVNNFWSESMERSKSPKEIEKKIHQSGSDLVQPRARYKRSMRVNLKGSFLFVPPRSPLRISEREPKAHSSRRMQTLSIDELQQESREGEGPGRKD
jgi:hypothetical protein